MTKLNVLGTEISVIRINDDDYISLTDMVRNLENGEFFILNWLRNRNTIEFLGIWERVYNTHFNPVEFDRIKSVAGLNGHRISVKEWCEKTNAIGIQARAGRYGGTYAHKVLNIIPKAITKEQASFIYANEADLMALSSSNE